MGVWHTPTIEENIGEGEMGVWHTSTIEENIGEGKGRERGERGKGEENG